MIQNAVSRFVRTVVLGCFLTSLSAVAYGWSWADKSGSVTLEPGITRVNDADITYIAALTEIEIPADASLVFENTQTLTLSARLSGAGSVYSGTAGTVVFAGDNSAHTGSMAFTNMNVTVTHRYGLGSATRTVEHCNARLLFKGNGLTNDVPLVIRDNRRDEDGNKFTENWTDPWRQNGHVLYCPNRWQFGNWTFAGGLKFQTSMIAFSIYWDCQPVILDEPIDFSRSLYLSLGFKDGYAASNDKRPLNLTLAAPNCKFDWHFAICAGVEYNGTYHRGLICGCANALDSSRPLHLGRSNMYKVMLDLNGYDQTVKQLKYPTYTGWECTPTRGMTEYCLVKSATAAKLTMTDNGDASVAYRFSGGVSLRQEGTGTYTILNQYCDTTGRLEVVKGSVAFEWDAGWGGDVEVFDGATVKFLDGARLNKKQSDVLIHDGGKIYVTDGVEVSCSSLVLGSKSIFAGRYTANDMPEWIEGNGTVRVHGNGLILVVK